MGKLLSSPKTRTMIGRMAVAQRAAQTRTRTTTRFVTGLSIINHTALEACTH